MQYHQTTGIDPHALGRKYNLGNFKRKYTRPFVFSPWWTFVPIVAFLLILLVPNLQAWIHDAANHALPPFPASLFIGMGGITVVLIIVLYGLVPPGIRMLKELKTGTPVALLYDQGFIMLTSKGDEQMVTHWPDLDVWHEVEEQSSGEGGSSYIDAYTFVDRSTGVSLKSPFGSQFHMAVEATVANYQYPSVQAAYQSGQIINFGRLSISSQGMYDTTTNAMLAWGDVASIKIDQAGVVRIKQQGQKREWASIPLGEIGNMATLYRLLMADVPRTFVFQNQARIS